MIRTHLRGAKISECYKMPGIFDPKGLFQCRNVNSAFIKSDLFGVFRMNGVQAKACPQP